MSQLFGMNNLLSALSGKQEAKETGKVVNGKNSIGNPKLSDAASKYYEELKAKYGDMEFILVDDAHIDNAKEQSTNFGSDKSMVVLISESELEEMAVNEDVRKKNEQFIEDAKAQMPDMLKQLKESGASVKSFGIEIKDGTASYFAVIDKSLAAQKERIEEKKENKKEDLVTINASSLDELLKKIQDITFEAKADSVVTPQEKLLGQSVDFSI